MSTKIFENGTKAVTVSSGQKIAVYSSGADTKVYQKVGYPNYPDSWNLLTTVTNQQYVSAAFSADTEIRIDAGVNGAWYETGASPVVSIPEPDKTGTDDPYNLTGLAGEQGGGVTVRGGASSSSSNAGGQAKLRGGNPGATGVGGAATVVAGNGGSTSGAGGVAGVTGGAGSAGNSSGGVGKVVGGAGQGSAAGGAAQATGGAGGATGAGGAATVSGGAGGSTSGAGGNAGLTGGPATAGNSNGGSVVLTNGDKAGTGKDGYTRVAGDAGTNPVVENVARNTIADAGTITVAQHRAGVIYQDASGGNVTCTSATGTNIDAEFPDLAVGNAIPLYHASNHATNTSTISGGSGVTLVGSGAVTNTGGKFLLIKTGSNAFDLVRVG